MKSESAVLPPIPPRRFLPIETPTRAAIAKDCFILKLFLSWFVLIC